MLTSPRVIPQFRDIAMHNSNLIVTSEGVEANRLSSLFFSTFWKQPLTTNSAPQVSPILPDFDPSAIEGLIDLFLGTVFDKNLIIHVKVLH